MKQIRNTMFKEDCMWILFFAQVIVCGLSFPTTHTAFQETTQSDISTSYDVTSNIDSTDTWTTTDTEERETTIHTTPAPEQTTSTASNEGGGSKRARGKYDGNGSEIGVAAGAAAGAVVLALAIAVALCIAHRQGMLHCACRKPDMVISGPMNGMQLSPDVSSAKSDSLQRVRKEEDERYSPAPGRKHLDQGELSNQSSYTDIQALERPKKKSSYVNVREAEQLKPQPQSDVSTSRVPSQYLHVSPGGMTRDPTYANLPNYDLPPNAFARKNSYAGDLLMPASALARKDSDIYVLPVAPTDVHKLPSRVFDRKQSEVYVVPLTRDNMKKVPSLAVFERKDSDLYIAPIVQTSEQHQGAVYQGLNDDEEIGLPSACSSRRVPNPSYLTMNGGNGGGGAMTGQVIRSPSGGIPSEVLQHLQQIHDQAKNEAFNNPVFKEEKAIYANLQTIQNMHRNDSYPGDIELPPKYARKKSKPFIEEDIYLNNMDMISEQDDAPQFEQDLYGNLEAGERDSTGITFKA